MELNLQKQTVSVNETVYDGSVEQPLECDVLLPDYCPDIQKILRCEVTPSLLAASVNGDRLSIDGVAAAHLYYLDENGCLRHAEYKIPYTRVIELRAAPQNPVITISQSVDYFNCRSVSARRLDMRGAVSIAARVYGQSEEQAVCSACEGGLEFCPETAENTRILPQASRQIVLREEVELGYGKPAIAGIIRFDASAELTDYKILTGKLVTKGELTVRIIYQCEEDAKKLEMMEYSLPVSQVVDIDGLEEDCACSAWYEVSTCEITPKTNSDGENRMFALECSMNACVLAHRRVQLDAACDCYSTQFECKPTIKPVPLLKLLEAVNETCMYKETLDLPPNVESIIDVWCAAGTPGVRVEQECVVVSGKMTICMFVCEAGGEVAYYDQVREYSHRIPLREDYETIVFTPSVCAGMATFSMNGHDKLEVRCPVRICGGLYSQYRKKIVCDVAIDESRPKPRHDNMLYLYYAAEHESIWEIAKRYNTSTAAIQAGNQLETGVLDGRKMLLIPMK